MAHLTGNFTSEAPLSPAVREAISAAFEQGWADPKKLAQASGRAAILADSAKSQLAAALCTTPSALEVIGEPALSHYIAIAGFLRPTSSFVTGTVDVGKIRAIARSHSGDVIEIGVDHHGSLLGEGLKISTQSVFSLQAVNGETGVAQSLDAWRGSAGRVIVDATRALITGDYVSGFSATTFDGQSWGGPAGMGFIAINDQKNFKYPLPHIAPIRTPGSYSLPLLIGSAVALEESLLFNEKIIRLRNNMVERLRMVSGITMMGSAPAVSSSHISIVIEEFSAEELLRSLLPKHISVDAGSACSPEDLTPSHVIASMGFSTPGHIRLTIHSGHQEADVEHFIKIFKETLRELRD